MSDRYISTVDVSLKGTIAHQADDTTDSRKRQGSARSLPSSVRCWLKLKVP
jgi:hypothetical protein